MLPRPMTELAHPDRLAKIETMRGRGLDPYPARGVQGTPVGEIILGAGSATAHGALVGQVVTIAGRMLRVRDADRRSLG